MPTALAQVRRLVAQMATIAPLVRDLTADEEALFSAAVEAGAVLNPRVLREYLEGVPGCPWQFEGCARSVHSGDQWAAEIVQANIARRERFYERVESGDLQAVLASINGAGQRKAA
jgi:hypothetical protein